MKHPLFQKQAGSEAYDDYVRLLEAKGFSPDPPLPGEGFTRQFSHGYVIVALFPDYDESQDASQSKLNRAVRRIKTDVLRRPKKTSWRLVRNGREIKTGFGIAELGKNIEALPEFRKQAYTLTNEGYGDNSTCYKCGQPIQPGQMTNYEGGMEVHGGACPISNTPSGNQNGWQSRLMMPPKQINPNIHPVTAGYVPLIFTVPLKSAALVADHLLRAGLDQFETTNQEDEGVTDFEFRSPQEFEAAHEYVRQQFTRQIDAGKGEWANWKQLEQVDIMGPQRSQQPRLSSAKRALTGLMKDILRPQERDAFPPPMRSKSRNPVCSNCGGGLTRRYVGDGSEKTELVCVTCDYSGKTAKRKL